MEALPRYDGPVDTFRNGFQSLEQQHMSGHPLSSYRTMESRPNMKEIDFARRTYGRSLAMQLMAERTAFKNSNRLPGLQSNSILCDTLSGKDNKISFEDFLDGSFAFLLLSILLFIITCFFTSFFQFIIAPNSRPIGPKYSVYDMMEAKLNL